MNINNNLARINIPHQEVLNILENRKRMKNNYLYDYHSYMKDILYIQSFKEKERKKWIEQELKTSIPWYIKIMDILGCIDDNNHIISVKQKIEQKSYTII